MWCEGHIVKFQEWIILIEWLLSEYIKCCPTNLFVLQC